MAIVYLHRRNDTNKVFYVGIGNQERRAYRTDTRNDLWTKIYKRHGRTVEIIHKDISWQEACSIEIKLIAFYRAYLGEKSLANFTNGGEGNLGKIFTEEQRKNMSNGQKKRFQNPIEMEKQKQRMKEIKKDPIYRKKLSESIKRAYENNPQLRENARQKTLQQLKKNPKLKETLSKASIKNWGSEEYRKKHKEATIKAMNNADIRQKIINSLANRIHSEESKLKRSVAMKGRKNSVDVIKKISDANKKIILNTLNGIFYFGLKEAADTIGIKEENLGQKLRGAKRNNTHFIYV